MREIKFRAWDGQYMINPYCELKEGNRFWGEDLTNTPYCDPISIMQYTGLKDRKHMEVYEKDRVRVWTKPNRDDYHYDGVVEWYLDRWIINFGEQKFPFNANLGNWHGDCEIIGNIYEHSHLLESK